MLKDDVIFDFENVTVTALNGGTAITPENYSYNDANTGLITPSAR